MTYLGVCINWSIGLVHVSIIIIKKKNIKVFHFNYLTV